MSTSVVSIRLPEDLKNRLDALSATTGRPAAFYLREALEEHITELEYTYQLQTEAEAIRRGELATISHQNLKTELGLD